MDRSQLDSTFLGVCEEIPTPQHSQIWFLSFRDVRNVNQRRLVLLFDAQASTYCRPEVSNFGHMAKNTGSWSVLK